MAVMVVSWPKWRAKILGSMQIAWAVLLGGDVLTAAWWFGQQRRSKLHDQSPFAGQNHEN